MEKPQLTKLEAWLTAARMPTLLIPTIQVAAGTGIAYAIFGNFESYVAFCAWLVAVAITVGTNFINDAIDDKRGGDPINKFGKIKVIPAGLLSRSQVYWAGILAFCLACATPLTLEVDSVLSFFIVLVCAACGYCYTGGPYPISYLGLSEIFIFVFYGGVCVIVPYYAQTYELTPEIYLAAAQLGLLAILPNALNNFRDIADDEAVNKRTLAVRFGAEFAKWELALLTFIPFMLLVLWWLLGYKVAAIVPLLLVPLAVYFVKGVWSYQKDRSINLYFGLSVLTHFLFGFLLIIGLFIG